jgi:hypothetical protein
VASSAVVREPKPLGPAVPARYLSELSMVLMVVDGKKRL